MSKVKVGMSKTELADILRSDLKGALVVLSEVVHHPEILDILVEKYWSVYGKMQAEEHEAAAKAAAEKGGSDV